MNDVIKRWRTSYGTLTLFYNDKITEENSVVTTWTYQEFLEKCDSRVFCVLMKGMYGDKTFNELIQLTQEEIDGQSQEEQSS
jgi:choline kinase